MAVDVSDLIAAVEAARDTIGAGAALRVVDMAKLDAPVSEVTPTNSHSGQLRDSIAVLDDTVEGNSAIWTVGSDLEYAGFTDEVDTSPHIIRAVNAPMLRFWWDRGPQGPGIYHYLWVRHPGTRGQRWFASRNAERWERALTAVSSDYNG